MKVLLIEDDAILRRNTTKALELENYEVVSCVDGQAGIEAFHQAPPDIIVCDVLMPRKDGYAVLKEVRESKHDADVPFIFTTAKALPEDIRNGMVQGVDDYLTKPFAVVDLVASIRVQLTKKARRTIQENMRAEAMRETIARTMPHELLTPLNSVLAMSEFLMVEAHELSTSEIKEIGRVIHSGGKRLLRTVERFIEFTRLSQFESNAMKLRSRNLMSETLDDFCKRLEENCINPLERQADFSSNAEYKCVDLDSEALNFLAFELLENAVKFSKNGQPVEISAIVSPDGEFQLCIKDRGRGMTNEEIESLAAFRQFDRERYEQQGSGLGLAIVSALVAQAKGVLEINPRDGGGLSVLVRIPNVRYTEIQRRSDIAM